MSKRFSTLEMDTSRVNNGTKAIEDQISSYIENGEILAEDIDPIDYWITCNSYPKLADYALDLLVVPCSSSASETLFSHVGVLSSGMKSRVSLVNLENQVLLKTNFSLML